MRLKNFILPALLLVVHSLHMLEGKRAYKIMLKKCDYFLPKPAVLRFANCSVAPSQSIPNVPALYGQLEMNENVSQFAFHISFDMLRKDNTNINLINYKLDGCKFLDGIYSHNLLQANLQEMRRVGNFPKKCPILAGVRYKIEGFVADPENYPPFLPSLSFTCKVIFFMNGANVGYFNLHGRVQNK